MLDGMMKMNGEHTSRNIINWWLVKLGNCVEMGDQVVNVISNSMKFFEEEKERLEKKTNRMNEKERSLTKADYDEYKVDKKTLPEVKKLLKEWESKYYYSQSLLNKLRATEKV